MPTVGDLTQATVAVTALLVAIAKVVSLWSKSKQEALDAHEERFDRSWKRQDELLDDSREDNDRLRQELERKDREIARLRAEVADCWARPEINRRRRPRSSRPAGGLEG